MTLRKMILVFIISITALINNACSCCCGKSEENTIKGFISVIGNDPFTKLAIKTDEGKFIILKSSKEMNEELNKKQGSYYLIHFSKKITDENNDVVIVEKAIPIKNDSK